MNATPSQFGFGCFETVQMFCSWREDVHIVKGVLAIRRIFFLVDMITNTNFSNCPYVFKIGVVWQ